MSSAALIRARRRIQAELDEARSRPSTDTALTFRAGLQYALVVIDEESERAAEREFTQKLQPEPVISRE